MQRQLVRSLLRVDRQGQIVVRKLLATHGTATIGMPQPYACTIVIAYYFIGSTSVKRILNSRIYNAKAMDERPNPGETDRPTMAEGASEYLRSVVQRNRGGGTVGSYAVCSAHPAVIDAAIQQALEDGTCLHVESTSSQVNQFGGYTGMTPRQFADAIRVAAASAGLPAGCVLLGADHLGPFAWRSEPLATAMAKACDLARLCVHADIRRSTWTRACHVVTK